MSRTLPLLAASVVFFGLGTTTRAQSTVWVRSPVSPMAAPTIYYSGMSPAGAVYSSGPAYYQGTIPASYTFPYSYYAARYPYPPRDYVGGYSNDYPYYGRPYGHPYDPWTWSYLSSYPTDALARYYYPPVP